MNIAHLLPYGAKFPLARHNGRYEWAFRLAALQVRQGHNVTVYAGPSSSAENPSLRWQSIPNDLGDKPANNLALFQLALANADHDIYHSHLDTLQYSVADDTERQILFTQHWFPSKVVADAVPQNTHRNVWAVPVTKYMRDEDTKLGIPCTDVIYHGVDLSLFAFSSAPRSDRLLYVGRIAPHKGVLEAVAMAADLHEKLDIVGKINAVDMAYWEQIKPMVDGERIRYLGPKSLTEVASLYRSAKATIFLPQHIEAFGQTIIESQACGTPVILNPLGANAELIDQGKTGFIVDSEAACQDAINNLDSLNPAACNEFAQQFDVRQMVLAYDELYERLLT